MEKGANKTEEGILEDKAVNSKRVIPPKISLPIKLPERVVDVEIAKSNKLAS